MLKELQIDMLRYAEGVAILYFYAFFFIRQKWNNKQNTTKKNEFDRKQKINYKKKKQKWTKK